MHDNERHRHTTCAMTETPTLSKSKTISLRLTEAQRATLAKIAIQLDRSESWLVRQALDAFLAASAQQSRGPDDAAPLASSDTLAP